MGHDAPGRDQPHVRGQCLRGDAGPVAPEGGDGRPEPLRERHGDPLRVARAAFAGQSVLGKGPRSAAQGHRAHARRRGRRRQPGAARHGQAPGRLCGIGRARGGADQERRLRQRHRGQPHAGQGA